MCGCTVAPSGLIGLGLREFFEVDRYGSTIRREVLAGVTTFVTMAYILLVNPAILSISGMPFGPVVIATALSAGIATLLTGLYAKKPFAMAPYMGENVLFTFAIVKALGVSWREALGAVSWGGVIFLLVSLLGVRAILARAVPPFLSASWSLGIGLFLMFVGFAAAGISMPNTPGAPVRVGYLPSTETLAVIAGTAVALALMLRRVPGSILLGVLTTMLLAALGGAKVSTGKPIAFPDWFQVAGKLDIVGALLNPVLIPMILVLFLVDTFDTMGTVLGLSIKAGFVDEKGRPVDVDKVFHVDALATVLGAVFGVSTVGTYIESATGIEEGGRTGLTAVVTGLLFLAAIALAPLIAAVDPHFLQLASAPALIAVGVMMMSVAKHIDFTDPTQAIPATITIAFMLFTYNIALGIAAGLIAYPLTAAAAGKARQVHPLAWILAVLSLLLYIYYPYTKPA